LQLFQAGFIDKKTFKIFSKPAKPIKKARNKQDTNYSKILTKVLFKTLKYVHQKGHTKTHFRFIYAWHWSRC